LVGTPVQHRVCDGYETEEFRRREGTKKICIFQCNVSFTSLNQGDAFVLEDIDVIYTWFGKDCFALENFEANRAAYVIAKRKKCNVVTDVVDNNNKILGIASWERQHQGCTSCARLQNSESNINKDDEMYTSERQD